MSDQLEGTVSVPPVMEQTVPDMVPPSDLWTASTLVDIPAETLSWIGAAGLAVPHLLAFAVLVVGLWFSFRRRSSLAIRSYLGGMAIAAAGLATVFVVTGRLDPAGTGTFAYAYTGDRLMTVLYDGEGIRDQRIVEGRIVEISGFQLPDGRMMVLATFENGGVADMTLDASDARRLVESMLAMDAPAGQDV